MSAKHAVVTEALLLILLVLHSLAEEDDYEFKSEQSKETWKKIQQMGDISSDSEVLLKQYTADNSDYCKQQLDQISYRADLDKKLLSYKSKIEYDDKLLQSDKIKCGSSESCKEELETKHQNNMDAYIITANTYIPKLKATALKNLKDFMDKCTQGQIYLTKNQDEQESSSSEDENQKTSSEPSDQYHW